MEPNDPILPEALATPSHPRFPKYRSTCAHICALLKPEVWGWAGAIRPATRV